MDAPPPLPSPLPGNMYAPPPPKDPERPTDCYDLPDGSHPVSIQMCSEMSSSSAAYPHMQHYSKEQGVSEKQKRIVVTWAKPIIIVTFASVIALLSITYTMNSNGTVYPTILFQRHKVSFLLLLVALMIAFYAAILASVLKNGSPIIPKAFSIIAWMGLILSFTVLMWALLPDLLSWLPWVFFALTILAVCRNASL